MKKSKFITGLSAAFVATMALMSCSSLIRGKDYVVLTIDGVEYKAEDLFGDQKTPAAAEAKFNAVYKVAVRRYFLDDKPGKDDMPEITNNTKIKISEQKATAQSNADKNGTSYNEEWQKILDSNGVEDEQGLYDKFEYELQKEKYENRWYEDHYKDLRSGKPFGEDSKFVNYLEGKQPYHIKHILVKLSNAKAGDSVNTEITAAEAEKLGNVIKSLAEGKSFAAVSDDYNDDDSAKQNKGSLGIMSRDTSFVNDFKLGTYMYESFFGTSTGTGSSQLYSKSAKEALGLDKGIAGDYASKISQIADPTSELGADTKKYAGLGQLPYEAALNLIKYANYDFSGSTKDSEAMVQHFKNYGLDTTKVAAKFLPRNVIFNKYFNKHNIMVITPRKLHDYTAKDDDGNFVEPISTWISVNTKGRQTRSNNPDKYLGTYSLDSTLIGFNRENIKKNTDEINFNFHDEKGEISNKNVLRDENGRIILMFRSGTGDSSSNDAYQGIHFVVIERSPFIAKETEEGHDGDPTTLDQYYTHYYPTESGGDHPKYTDGKWRKTFVNYFPNLVKTEDLKARADTVKDELKKSDSKLNTYLYQILEKDIQWSSKAIDLGIKKNIDDWIKISRVSEELDKKKTWDDTWEDYYYSLESQTEQRAELSDGQSIHSKLVPEACVFAFWDDEYSQSAPSINLSTLFGEGGVFHE